MKNSEKTVKNDVFQGQKKCHVLKYLSGPSIFRSFCLKNMIKKTFLAYNSKKRLFYRSENRPLPFELYARRPVFVSRPSILEGKKRPFFIKKQQKVLLFRPFWAFLLLFDKNMIFLKNDETCFLSKKGRFSWNLIVFDTFWGQKQWKND